MNPTPSILYESCSIDHCMGGSFFFGNFCKAKHIAYVYTQNRSVYAPAVHNECASYQITRPSGTSGLSHRDPVHDVIRESFVFCCRPCISRMHAEAEKTRVFFVGSTPSQLMLQQAVSAICSTTLHGTMAHANGDS